jgi:hypothetical protein
MQHITPFAGFDKAIDFSSHMLYNVAQSTGRAKIVEYLTYSSSGDIITNMMKNTYIRSVLVSLAIVSTIVATFPMSPAIAAVDPGACTTADVSGSITGAGSATVTNTTNHPCTVALGSFNLDPDHGGAQTPFDHTSIDIGGGNTKSLSVGMPECSWQLDLYAGNYTGQQIPPDHLIDSSFGGPDGCNPGGGGSGPKPPVADIKANNSDGPISITYNTSATLTWTSKRTASCNVTPGNLTGTDNTTGVSTGNLTNNKTYTLTCIGHDGSTVTDSVRVNVGSAPVTLHPTADIKANGSDSTITIQSGSSAQISWSSTNAVSCNVSPINGSGISGGQSSGALTGTQTFTVNCSSATGETASDSVTVNVQTVTNNCPAPTVTTSAATNVTQTSATLNGTVNPNGNPATVTFSYGTSQTMGIFTSTQTVSGNSPVTISASISNLQPNTTYYFRISASNTCGGGTANGSVLTFTTTDNGNSPTADIKANGQDGVVTVAYNSAAQITWNSQFTSSCTVSPTGWTGISGNQSSQNITGTITFNLNCTGTNGQNVSDSVTVQTSNTNYNLPTVVLNANPTVINQGQTSLLSWYSTNATYCYASAGPWSGNKALQNSETVSPSNTSTYTITCTNNYGSASDSETVFVNGINNNTQIGVTKLVRNITLNQFNFSQTVDAQSLDSLEFEIRVRNNDSFGRNLTVQDILPSELFYVTGSTTVNGVTVSDGITSNGLNLGFVNAGEEKVIHFRTVVFSGVTDRTITNQARANSTDGTSAFGTAFANVNIRNRGSVLGVSDIVTGGGDSLLLAIMIGFILALMLFAIGKRRGWFELARAKREAAHAAAAARTQNVNYVATSAVERARGKVHEVREVVTSVAHEAKQDIDQVLARLQKEAMIAHAAKQSASHS